MIERADRLELARLLRFAPAGHPIWSNPRVYEVFARRFAQLGGMSPAISKALGWGSR